MGEGEDQTNPGAGAARKRVPRILVVSPDPGERRLMSVRLKAADYLVETVCNGPTALDACVRARPNLVISDMRLESLDGLGLLKELKSRWPQMMVIVVTDYNVMSQAVLATQRGAFSYLVRPVDKAELLGHTQRALLEANYSLLQTDWQAELISRNKLMEYRLQELNWAAGSDVPVLLTGQIPTAKELLARAIHAASDRRRAAFLTVNCSNPFEHLMAEELFGDGSATLDGIVPAESGALRAARGGTLLLNEISDLSMGLQTRLVAALRNYSVHFNRNDSRIAIDVRVICTTSHDLRPLLENGTFSGELFNQINILPIEIPPLGRRREDIPLLISHFLEQATERRGTQKIYSPAEIEQLATDSWPKHVRELFDLVKQDVALTRDQLIPEVFPQPSFGWEIVQDRSTASARERAARDRHAYDLASKNAKPMQSPRMAKRNRNRLYKLLARFWTPEEASGPTAH